MDREDFKLSGDVKILLLLTGKPSASVTKSCLYSSCYRFDNIKGEMTGAYGQNITWVKVNENRTWEDNRKDHHKWITEHGSDPDKLPECNNVKFPPIKILSDRLEKKPILFWCPCPPLHSCLLGK